MQCEYIIEIYKVLMFPLQTPLDVASRVQCDHYVLWFCGFYYERFVLSLALLFVLEPNIS